MHDLLYERASEWQRFSADDVVEVLIGYARELGLDTDQFAQDLEKHTFQEKIQAQYQDAVAMQLRGTPTFIVSGPIPPQVIPLDAFVMLFTPGQYESPPPQVIDTDRQYIATIQTEKGEITIELYPDQAPLNVNSFVFLARDGWYDGVRFYQVIPGIVAVAGDPTRNLGYYCENEVGELTFDKTGIVGAFKDGFFITLSPQPDLNGRLTPIGKVISGIEVVQNLTPANPGDPTAPPGDVIQTIVVEEE